MFGEIWKWVALFAAAGVAAGLAARLVEALARRRPARPGAKPRPAPFVPQKTYREALAAVSAFLVVALAGGHLLLADLGPKARLHRAETAAAESFRATPLLRALAEADPPRAEGLRARYVAALVEAEAAPLRSGAPDPGQAALRTLMRQAGREALDLAMRRLANASDEAAARLAEALLQSLKALNTPPDGTPIAPGDKPGDPLLCLGLLHPAGQSDSALTETALERLPDSTRKQLEDALALVLASSTMRPHAAPLPSRADAALADMFVETLPAFQQAYGGPREVRALFEALADPAQSRNIAPELLCSFAQDLLRALLRMPPDQRGDGLRRLLGNG